MKIRMLVWCCLWVCLGVGCISRAPSIASDEPSAPVEMELLLVGPPTLKQLKNHAVISFTGAVGHRWICYFLKTITIPPPFYTKRRDASWKL